jgi:hypothetical protein
LGAFKGITTAYLAKAAPGASINSIAGNSEAFTGIKEVTSRN